MNTNFAALRELASGTTRKSPHVRFRSAIPHITDISSRSRGHRSASSFLTNTYTPNSAPRFALKVTPFRDCTVAPDLAPNNCTFVLD